MASNTIRFTGLASGMDTESIVKAMMGTYQAKIDKQTKTQQLNTWKQEAWKDMNKKIADFQTKYIDKLRLQSTYIKNKVSTSNDGAISVGENTLIPEGTHSIEIHKLATSPSIVGDAINSSNAITKTTTLGEIKDADGKAIFEEDATSSFQINGETLQKSSTIEDVITAIKKGNEDINVNFDEKNKRFFITSKKTGEEAKVNLNITGNTEVAKKALGLSNSAAPVQGENAEYSYNNIRLTSSSNEVEVNGMEITLKAVTTQPITVQSTPDTEGTVSFIKEFVTEYNKLMADINTKLTTKTKSSYQPLTDEEKENSSDEDIKKIENYIKDGLFYRDPSLTALRDTLRDTLGEVVKIGENADGTSKSMTLQQIGLTTGEWREQGKLYLDEDKLTKALEEDAEGVMKLFAGKSEEANEEGLFTRLYNSFDQMSKSIVGLKSYGSYYNDKVLTDQMKETADKITTLNKAYTTKENALFAKFAAMEKMMTQLNSQQSYLTSMLGQ